MEINITKKDIIWSYLAQFFNFATGLITLPLILKLLTPEEVGINYILISINSIVVLFDMGFSSQFSRYLTYIFSGAQTIQKEGIPIEYSEQINEHLLACTIVTAKRIYFVISLVAFLCLISFGTWYIYVITNAFTIIPNAFVIWIVFCVSSFFNIYYLYFNAFLQGRGLVKDSKQAQVYSRVCQVLITFVMILFGCGLLSVVVANLIAPFILRYMAYKKFYTTYIQAVLKTNTIEHKEIYSIFNVLFYNAKKLGIIGILSSSIGYVSTLVMGKYLSLADVGSYGLMVQLTGIIMGISTIYFTSVVPRLANLVVRRDYVDIKKEFGLAMFCFYSMSLAGIIGMIMVRPLFSYLDFKTQLPCYTILILYYIYKFLEQNQNLYSQLFLVRNDMRFYHAAVVTGITSFVCLWGSLHLGYGLWGVILAQSIPLFAYSAWKWPVEAVRMFQIDAIDDFVRNPIKQTKKNLYGRNFQI